MWGLADLEEALLILSREDPSLRVTFDSDTGQVGSPVSSDNTAPDVLPSDGSVWDG